MMHGSYQEDYISIKSFITQIQDLHQVQREREDCSLDKMRIQVIFGVLLIYTHVVMGSLFQDHVVCRFNQIKPCYVAVGQRLHLQMPWEDGFDLKTPRFILRYRKTQSSPPTTHFPRWQFANDSKTMILTSAERCDSGTYTLNIVDGDEKSKGISTLQVNTEAQVSSVKLSYSCLFSGDMKVFCSADGDNLHFSWTFTSASFTRLEDDNKTLVLYGTHNDIVTCHVENDVSHDQNSIKLSECTDFTTVVVLVNGVWLFVTGLFCMLTVFFVLYVLTARQRDRIRKFCNPARIKRGRLWLISSTVYEQASLSVSSRLKPEKNITMAITV